MPRPRKISTKSTAKVQKSTKKKRPSRKTKRQEIDDLVAIDDLAANKKADEEHLERILDDLDRSYLGQIKPDSPEPKPPRNKRWKHKGKESLDDEEKLPKDWTDSDPDLSEDDLEGQIQRMHERIEDNIMVTTFQSKLSDLEDKLAYRKELASSEPEGLSLSVIERLDGLKFIQKILEENGDPHSKLESVKAIIAAYRTGGLEWHEGLVTYWCQGRQISQPRPFESEEARLLGAHFEKDGGIWVESLDSPGFVPTFACFSMPPNKFKMFTKKFKVKLPGHQKISNIEFMDDTGCADVMVYEKDVLDRLDGPRRETIPTSLIIAYRPGISAVGTTFGSMVVMMTISLKHQGRQMIPPTNVKCCVFPPGSSPSRMPRLMGNFFRSVLFTAQAPDNRYRVIVSDNRDELIAKIPNPDIKSAKIPPRWWLEVSDSDDE